MRLTSSQIEYIRQTTRENFGAGASVWLFGSRVDDARRGGDVDLYVEPTQESTLISALRCKIELEDSLDLRVDLPRPRVEETRYTPAFSSLARQVRSAIE